MLRAIASGLALVTLKVVEVVLPMLAALWAAQYMLTHLANTVRGG